MKLSNSITSSMSATPSTPQPDHEAYNVEISRVVQKIGFTNATKLGKTLQGSVWRVSKSSASDVDTAVLKATSKYLYKRSVTIVNDREFKVKEDIFSEQSILKYLTQHKNCPDSIVKYRWFFKTRTDYYLLMQYGGSSLFDFVIQSHQYLSAGYLDRREWNKVCLFILKQMIECIEYIHSMRVCHFDISLENFLINDVDVIARDGKIKFILEDIHVKLCDFGLAHRFSDELSSFQSRKFCGKTQYKSPEVVRCDYVKPFDAKKNDVWAMGICAFMMIYGCPPWRVANLADIRFAHVTRHSLNHLLKRWNISQHANEAVVNLLDSILKYEENRMCLRDIKQYIRDYIEKV